jgi:hypothetical protein
MRLSELSRATGAESAFRLAPKIAAEILQARLRPELRPGWKPLPGPQTDAFNSSADVTLYGGAAGGGKTDLALGLAITSHEKSILFRREFPQLADVEERLKDLLSDCGRYSGSRHVATTSDGRRLELGHVQREDDKVKYKGRPHDLIIFDETTEFTESQVRFLMGWLRTATPGQRCRVIMSSNPPVTNEGQWLIKFFAPWLEPRSPNPAKPGELRWFVSTMEGDLETDGPDKVEIEGKILKPMSRTFVPASVEDNPFYMETGYARILEALPEPLRSAFRYGSFDVSAEEDPFQVIPADWIDRAMDRWEPTCPGKMDAVGVDPARGGKDNHVIAPRHGTWFANLIVRKGRDLKDGPEVAAWVIQNTDEGAEIRVDVIGIGSSPYDFLKESWEEGKVIPLNGAEGSKKRDTSKKLKMANKRAEWYWTLREDLDPVNGRGLKLPPSQELRADLIAQRWKPTARGVLIQDKKEIKVRLGRSPDFGDAVAYANSQGEKSGWGAV